MYKFTSTFTITYRRSPYFTIHYNHHHYMTMTNARLLPLNIEIHHKFARYSLSHHTHNHHIITNTIQSVFATLTSLFSHLPQTYTISTLYTIVQSQCIHHIHHFPHYRSHTCTINTFTISWHHALLLLTIKITTHSLSPHSHHHHRPHHHHNISIKSAIKQ